MKRQKKPQKNKKTEKNNKDKVVSLHRECLNHFTMFIL